MYLGVREGELGLSEVEKLSSIARAVEAGPDSVRREGTYYVAVEPNAFGLPAVDSCPGSTQFCEQGCYAIGSEKRPATRRAMERNLKILEDAGTVDGMVEKLDTMMFRYVARAKVLGVNPEERHFRIHWDGDFFSLDYASAWRRVINDNPGIKFFVYTRSFTPEVNVLPILSGLDNLDLFISVDRGQRRRGGKSAARFS